MRVGLRWEGVCGRDAGEVQQLQRARSEHTPAIPSIMLPQSIRPSIPLAALAIVPRGR